MQKPNLIVYERTMETRFSITVTLGTANGGKAFGSFDMGTDKNSSTAIQTVKGRPFGQRHISVELMEWIADLPVPIGIVHCNLEELKENIALITKEIFKIHHLEH